MGDKFLIAYNKFLCHCLYFPIALTFMTIFTFLNILYVPIAYFKHTITLIRTLTDGDETMDEFSEKMTRLQTIIIFIFTAPVIFIMSVPMDSVVFFRNMYTSPHNYGDEADWNLISEKALEIFQTCCASCLKEFRT